jgi:hypothetical protein
VSGAIVGLALVLQEHPGPPPGLSIDVPSGPANIQPARERYYNSASTIRQRCLNPFLLS